MSTSINWSLDVTEIVKRLTGLSGKLSSPDLARILVTSAEATIIPAARREVSAKKAIFEGNLFKSLAGRIRSSIAGSHTVEIGTLGVFYGRNIEEGTPSGSSAMSPKLVRWARLKLRARDPIRTAMTIARGIRAHGTQANPFLEPAWLKTKDAFNADVQRRIASRLRAR